MMYEYLVNMVCMISQWDSDAISVSQRYAKILQTLSFFAIPFMDFNWLEKIIETCT